MSQQSHESIPSGYVRSSTLYMAVVASLIIGLFLGNLFTTIFATKTETERRQVSVPSTEQASPNASQDFNAHILELEQQLLTDPNNVANWTHLGHLYFDSQQYKPAIRAYLKSLELEPNNANVWTDLGVMYRSNKQHDKALDAFAHAVSLEPTHETARFNSGIVLYFDLAKHAEGLAQWQDLLAINPNAKAPNGMFVRDMIQELQTK
ncbi:MAG: tetratricopeptide repeat protein [Pseudomonadota bacterium]